MHCMVFTSILHYSAFSQSESKNPIDKAQSSGSFNIHVDVDLVTTDVTVTGADAPEFQASDFAIYEDDVSQNLTYFSRDQLPIAVALLVDSSGSIEKHLNELQIAALTALRRLKAEDQVALYSFSGGYRKLSNLTADRLHIAKLLSHLSIMEGGTDIFYALQDATRYLKRAAPHHRRAIILISDNCHANGKARPDKMLNELLESATTLYDIVTPSDHSDLPYCLMTDPAIRKISADSGGEIVDVRNSMSLKGALGKAISRIRMQYTLGFNPSDPSPKGTYHRLKVRFADENRCRTCRIIGRSGYYSGASLSVAVSGKTQEIAPPHSTDSDQQLLQRIILIAGTSSPEFREIPFTVTTEKQTALSGKREVKLDLRINPSEIEFQISKGKRTYKVVAAILHADAKGEIKGCESWVLEDQLSREEFDRIIRDGIHVTTTVNLEPQNQMLKAVIYDENSGKLGSGFVFGSYGER